MTFRAGPGLADSEPVPRIQCIDGIDLLEQVLLSHAPAALANGDRLLLTVTPEVRRHWGCDPCLLRQVLDNLLGNAIKFTEHGQVRLVVRYLDDNQRTRLHLTVIDTGIGIAPENQAKIFEEFGQADPSIAQKYGGTGLGMAIVKRTVDGLDGFISVDSQLGEGTKFTVSIPVQSVDLRRSAA